MPIEVRWCKAIQVKTTCEQAAEKVLLHSFWIDKDAARETGNAPHTTLLPSLDQDVVH